VSGGVGDRAHLSIGEVLSLLREEFADITISKIRFLESQGLVDPERTPSGYRKFYGDDVERLRWILRQQREHFLPLKVIKGRLSEAGSETDVEDSETEEILTNGAAPSENIEPVVLSQESFGLAPAAPTVTTAGPETDPSPAPSPVATVEPPIDTPGKDAGSLPSPPETSPLARRAGPPAEPGTVNMTLEELAVATGLEVAAVRELERFGLLTGRDLGGTTYFDAEALAVAHMAAGFARHGVEARHLRMYKNAAERETGLFEQVVMPLYKQRNPQARQQAMSTLDELSRLGAELRGALLRGALRDAF
jgi:DNA-binding transcriptional MerR regulator